ncbi:unnamed protein product, partial [Candidula unifasciata]
MAHKTAQEVSRPVKKTASAFRPRPSPAEVMHNRIVEMQKRALLRAARREGRESELAASSLIVSQKKREAHTPTVKTPTKSAPTSSGPVWSPNSFYNKKKPEPATSTDDKKLVTIASTASKTEKRVAHEPTQ